MCTESVFIFLVCVRNRTNILIDFSKWRGFFCKSRDIAKKYRSFFRLFYIGVYLQYTSVYLKCDRKSQFCWTNCSASFRARLEIYVYAWTRSQAKRQNWRRKTKKTKLTNKRRKNTQQKFSIARANCFGIVYSSHIDPIQMYANTSERVAKQSTRSKFTTDTLLYTPITRLFGSHIEDSAKKSRSESETATSRFHCVQLYL